MTRVEAAALARAAKAKDAPSLAERFWSKVEIGAACDCWPWRAATRRRDEGYGAFWIEGRHQPASKVAFLLAKGPVPAGKYVCHTCDHPWCCNPGHLFVGSPQINVTDKVIKRRHAFGSRNGVAKLSEEQAAEIKRLKPEGRCPHGHRAEIAARYGVKPATITDIWSRSWTHLI